MSPCEKQELSPISGQGVKIHADSFPLAPTGEVQATPGSKPSPCHLHESPGSRGHSSGAPTLQKGHSVFAEETASQWACPGTGSKTHLVSPGKKSQTLPGSLLCAPRSQEGRGSADSTPSKVLRLGKQGSRAATQEKHLYNSQHPSSGQLSLPPWTATERRPSWRLRQCDPVTGPAQGLGTHSHSPFLCTGVSPTAHLLSLPIVSTGRDYGDH